MRSPRIERFGLALLLAAGASAACAQEVRLLVQRSPLAGFRHHEGPRLFADLAPGARLDLVREPSNAYDGNAVRVEWQGHKLGYVPRSQNAVLAWAMDRGDGVEARIAKIGARRRIEFEVFVR